MDKKYVFAGILLSAFLHITFFTMPNLFGGRNIEIPKGIPEEMCPIEARIPEEPVKEEIKKAPAKEPEKKIEDMEEVFKPDSVETEAAPQEEGNIKIEEPTDEYMPALKMDISDYNALMGAVRYFGMKIALIDTFGNFVDEIKAGKVNKIVPIEQGLSEYSNRIRMLPVNYFGRKIEKIMSIRELSPCILVPAEVDRQFAALQKEVIANRGHALEDVKSTAGRFIREGDAYKLIIERLYLTNRKEDFL